MHARITKLVLIGAVQAAVDPLRADAIQAQLAAYIALNVTNLCRDLAAVVRATSLGTRQSEAFHAGTAGTYVIAVAVRVARYRRAIGKALVVYTVECPIRPRSTGTSRRVGAFVIPAGANLGVCRGFPAVVSATANRRIH